MSLYLNCLILHIFFNYFWMKWPIRLNAEWVSLWMMSDTMYERIQTWFWSAHCTLASTLLAYSSFTLTWNDWRCWFSLFTKFSACNSPAIYTRWPIVKLPSINFRRFGLRTIARCTLLRIKKIQKIIFRFGGDFGIIPYSLMIVFFNRFDGENLWAIF